MADDYERLVVLIEARLDQFEKAMKTAERSGTRTYQNLQRGAFKATTAIEQQMLASAKAQGRALDQVFGQTVERANKSAKESANFYREVEKGRAAVDALRASIDPVFAASKRYESAVMELNRALDLGIISQGQHTRLVAQAGEAFLSSGMSADRKAGFLSRLGNISNATRGKLQNLGFQVQDVAVQMSMGTSAFVALGQQLPQLLGPLGLIGVAFGTLAAIGLPLLGAAFASTGGEAEDFSASMSAVQASVSAMNDAAAMMTAEGLVAMQEKYGELNATLVEFIRLQTEATQRQGVQDVRSAMATLTAEMETFWASGAWDGLQRVFQSTVAEANALALAMQDVSNAATFDEQLSATTRLREMVVSVTGGIDQMDGAQFAFYQKVLQSEDALRQLVASEPGAGWLGGAIGQAQALASAFWEAAAAKKAATDVDSIGDDGSVWRNDPNSPTTRPQRPGVDSPAIHGPARKGGGGGRKTSPLDQLLQDLETQREVVTAWYEESLLTLQTATDAQLVAIGGRHEAIERLEAEHRDRLRGIRDESDTGALANAESFFGAMATMTAAGGDKLVKVTRIFGAAEALINTYRAQAQVLADPKLSFWAKLPAAAAIGAAGLSMVSAIKGGGSSGGSRGSSGGGRGGASEAAAPAEPAKPVQVIVKGLDPKALFTGAMVMELYDALKKEAGNQGIDPVWS